LLSPLSQGLDQYFQVIKEGKNKKIINKLDPHVSRRPTVEERVDLKAHNIDCNEI
jgi:hypothetical protein